MTLRKMLLADPNQSRGLAVRVAGYACESEANFKELIQCFLSDDWRLTQRASWSLSMAAKQKPELLGPHIGTLVSQLQRTDVHDAVVRNTVRILEGIAIPEQYQGEVMDACFNFILDRKTAIAIKAFSLTILFNLSKIYPEIKKELRIIIEENMDFETAAFRARGRKILEKIR